jgi:glycosyltransferase involved in cell wall biosynthesis
MRVALFPGIMPRQEGGGGSLRSTILAGLQNARGWHEFVLCPQPPSSAGKSTSPAQSPSFEEQSIRDNDADLAWLLNPFSKPVSAPYFATVWDLEHRKQPYFPEVGIVRGIWEQRERIYQTLLPRAARVITGTLAGKNEVEFYYRVRPENVRVVRFPVSYEYLDAGHGIQPVASAKYGVRNSFIIYPAHFWAHKNHVNLLLALQQLNDGADTPLELVLTGADKGNLPYVRDVIGELGLSASVHLLGFIPDADLASLYREAVGMVFPSFFGPDNLPPLEAFACGCPVAMSQVAGSDEGLEDAAIFFDPANSASIAEAIQTLRTNAPRRAALVARGRELVRERTPHAYVEAICALLDEFEPLRQCWGKEYVQA